MVDIVSCALDCNRGTISLIGDSILDNYYMLPNRDQDLRKDLEDLKFSVNNYAVEDARLNNIRYGVVPGEKYITSRCYPYLLDCDGKMYPLKLLARNSSIFNTFTPVYETLSTDSDMAVFSIGGHDLQDGVTKIVFGADYFFNSVVSPSFISEYDFVIEEIKRHTSKIILISMYLPFLGPGASYGIFCSLAIPFIKRWRSFLQEMGKKHNIPILDLSQTVNSYNRDHYGVTDIYPSNITSKCMAECISYIYDHYDGYHVYFAPDCDINKITTVVDD